MAKTYIGIDNGATGSIGVVRSDGKIRFGAVPNKSEQSYTKKKQKVTRVDVIKLREFLLENTEDVLPFDEGVHSKVLVIIERPMVNPGRFKNTLSAMRALEAVLNVVELLQLPYQYMDSREWQKALLPEGTTGPAALKLASLQIGTRLFPQVDSKHNDRDGLLIAEYARRKGL